MSVAPGIVSSAVVVASRRRAPRVGADDVDVEITSILVPARLGDLGGGGFCVETRCSLRVGAVHAFRFTTDAGHTMHLDARVVHCRRKATDDMTEEYVTGCEFVHNPTELTDRLVDKLMDAATGVLTFEP